MAMTGLASRRPDLQFRKKRFPLGLGLLRHHPDLRRQPSSFSISCADGGLLLAADFVI
ncbi:MAG: hypothetical protein MZV64_64270 [Ignavibacteriales bacterium]|nr:hypothetical protein [Ignavibacteriales bacterium]